MAFDLAVYAADLEQVTAGSPEIKTRNGHRCIGFDAAAAAESITHVVRIPTGYASGSNATLTVFFMATSATSGNVRWQVEVERLASAGQDLDADGFATAVTVDQATSGTSGILSGAAFTLSNSNLDTCAAGDLLRIKLTRLGSHANDTMTGDAEFVYFTITQA